jgi:hypothetical protein
MSEKDQYKNRIELLQGTLDMLILQTLHAEDPAIAGKSIEIAQHPVTVIGVAPEGVVGAMPGIREDLWVTLDPLGTDV